VTSLIETGAVLKLGYEVSMKLSKEGLIETGAVLK